MKYGVRKYNEASCKVLKPTSLPMHMHRDVREIISIHVPVEYRRRGLASELMKQVIAEADKFKMVLILTVDPFEDGEMTRDQLEEWYGTTFDFHRIQDEPRIMARMFPVYIKSPVARAIENINEA